MKPIQPQRYVCYRAENPPKIDGRLDDKVWKSAPSTVEFADIEGPDHPRPRFRTTAKMMWDADYFYIAVQMEEPHVWGTLIKHDSVIFHDNDFEVFIDPNGDNHQYYEFELNALNTGWDLFLPRPYSDGGGADDGWEIPGLKNGSSYRWHSERSIRYRQRLVGGNRDSLARIATARTSPCPAPQRGPMASEFFSR